MYRSFELRNFRCFQELKITDLEKVNLFAGINNVGKTSLLEALFLHCGAYNPELAIRLNAFRGIESLKIELGRSTGTPWDSLFTQFDTAKRVELRGENEKGSKRTLFLKVVRQPEELAQIRHFAQPSSKQSNGFPNASEIAQVLELEYKEGGQQRKFYMILDPKGGRIEPIPPAPPFPAFFQGDRLHIPLRDEAERFGNLEIRGQQEVILEVLKIIEPRLRRLAMVVATGEPMLHGDIGIGRLVPLPLMGAGIVRLASLVLHIGNAPNGIVLVDEIENGLHHSILIKVWKALMEVAQQFNTQIFATTHSFECILAAHRAFEESQSNDFRLHRLDRIKDNIKLVTYDRESLAAAVETGLEVR